MGYQFHRWSGLNSGTPVILRRTGRLFALALVTVLIAALVSQLNPPAYDGSRIAAGPFTWPVGCPQRTYRVSDRLPRACLDRFQTISPEWSAKHGLKLDAHRGKTHYYRLGNDAVRAQCASWQDPCEIKRIYPGLFIAEPLIAGPTSANWQTIASK